MKLCYLQWYIMWNLYDIIHIWTAVVDESEEWSSQLIFQFTQLERWSLKKIRASTGFEPVTSAIPVRCSTNWAMKPHNGSEVNLLSSYLPWGVKWYILKKFPSARKPAMFRSIHWRRTRGLCYCINVPRCFVAHTWFPRRPSSSRRHHNKRPAQSAKSKTLLQP